VSLSKLWKGVRSIAGPALGGLLGGPAGAVVGNMLAGSSSKPPSMMSTGAMPVSYTGNGNLVRVGGGSGSFGTLRPMPGAGTGQALQGLMTGGARAAGYAAGRIAASAMNYCRRNPQWCATVGGAVAVEAMIRAGQLPAMKRRRGRGITSVELRNFKRVAKFTSKYCAPVRRAMKAPVMRKAR